MTWTSPESMFSSETSIRVACGPASVSLGKVTQTSVNALAIMPIHNTVGASWCSGSSICVWNN